MQNKFKTGLISALSAVVLAGAGISTASAENTSSPYQPQKNAAAKSAGGNCGYSDPMRGYRSPTRRFERERYGYEPRRPYPRYRSHRSRRGGSWGGMPWGGDRRGSSFGFGSDDMPWGNRRGRNRGFNFGSDDFKPWDSGRRGRDRGFNFGSSDFKPW